MGGVLSSASLAPKHEALARLAGSSPADADTWRVLLSVQDVCLASLNPAQVEAALAGHCQQLGEQN
jgi:hypothetical protein